jgi:hypothetical protein
MKNFEKTLENAQAKVMLCFLRICFNKFRTYAKHFFNKILSLSANVVIPAKAGIHKKTCQIALKISYLYSFLMILSAKTFTGSPPARG